jgi:hypothetical protein
MKIERGGSIYEVIDEVDTDYQVQTLFRYSCKDGKSDFRMLKLWWDKKYCNPVKGE